MRILATSREFLGVRGERALSTPPLDVADDPACARESDAVELFMVRASAAAPSFDADMADVATVAQICRRLDGLPLAIELAAARLRALSLEQLATPPLTTASGSCEWASARSKRRWRGATTC